MNQRIYAITNKLDNSSKLVQAANPAQALRWVAKDTFEVKSATANVVASMMAAGAKLEQAAADPA